MYTFKYLKNKIKKGWAFETSLKCVLMEPIGMCLVSKLFISFDLEYSVMVLNWRGLKFSRNVEHLQMGKINGGNHVRSERSNGMFSISTQIITSHIKFFFHYLLHCYMEKYLYIYKNIFLSCNT